MIHQYIGCDGYIVLDVFSGSVPLRKDDLTYDVVKCTKIPMKISIKFLLKNYKRYP